MTRPVLIVTGGSRGIGAATCIMAAKRGYDVAVNYQGNAESAAKVVAECEVAGAKAVAIQGDMASATDIIRLFAEAKAALGPISHVVNNAGITGKASPLADADTAVIRACIDVNVTGAILVAREAARALTANTDAPAKAIVNISSAAATLGSPGEYVWYAASKGAVDTLTIGLSKELAPAGHPRQRGLARRHRDRDPRPVHRRARPRRPPRAVGAAPAGGDARRDRRGGAVPALGGVGLYDGSHSEGRRRTLKRWHNPSLGRRGVPRTSEASGRGLNDRFGCRQ